MAIFLDFANVPIYFVIIESETLVTFIVYRNLNCQRLTTFLRKKVCHRSTGNLKKFVQALCRCRCSDRFCKIDKKALVMVTLSRRVEGFGFETILRKNPLAEFFLNILPNF